MKWLLRAGIALAVVALVASAILVPRLLDRPEVRARIAEGARQATGREFSFSALDVSWLPPGFEVTDALLAPAGDEAPLGADRVALRVALMPLLGGTIAVDRLEIDGAVLEIVRGPDGIEIPVRAPDTEPATREATDPSAAEAETADSVDGGADDPISLAVRRVTLRDARVVLIDRTTPEPLRMVWTDLQADARGRLDPDAPIAFEASAALESGGVLEVNGEASLAGDWSAQLALSDLVLAPFATFIEDLSASGVADIEVSAEGSGGDPAHVELTVDARGLDVVLGDLALEGDVPVRLNVDATASGGQTGPLELDLSAAAIRSGTSLDKPAGSPLVISGDLEWDGAEALRLAGAQLTLPGVIASGDVALAPKPSAQLSAPSFDPAPLAAWAPALGDVPVEGRIGLEQWSVSLEPLTLGGAIHLEAVRLPLEDGHAAELSGMLRGDGRALVGSGLQLRVADQAMTLSLRVSSLDAAPVARVELEGSGLESASLLAAIGGPADSLSGPLDLRAVVEAPLDSEHEISQVARGRAHFEIAPGRLRGVSLLRSTFDAFGAFGDVALLAGQNFGGSTLQKFYGEDFERLTGSATVADGVARTDDLRLEYRDYSADLAGTYRLADQRIDMTGQLTLYAEIDRALADSTPTATPGATQERSVEKVIPLARVTGTLDEPKVQLTRGAVVAFTRSYLDQRGRLGRLESEVDERLGEGAGKAVFDVLEGILGSGGRPRETR